MRIGIDIDEAMQHTADRIRVPDFRFFVVALKLQRRTGGSLAETLANLSSIIRRRKEIRLKARALTSEAKASATVLGLLPVVLGALLFFLNHDLMVPLLSDPRGRFMLGVASPQPDGRHHGDDCYDQEERAIAMPSSEPLIDTIGSYLTIQIGQIVLGPVATAVLIASFAAALLSAFYLWRIGTQEERLDRLVALRGPAIDRTVREAAPALV